MTHVLPDSTSARSGKPPPWDWNNLRISLATPMPPAMPTMEDTTPISSDSVSTERVTWRFRAPTARSSANSRTRWPRVVLNTVLMRNPATNSVTKAKTSNAVRKIVMN